MSEELKVVLSIKDGIATIGVQQPSSDPHIESVAYRAMSGIVQEVPAVVARASARWDEAPLYPAYARPAPSTSRRTPRDPGSAQVPVTEGGAAQDQPETLRLL